MRDSELAQECSLVEVDRSHQMRSFRTGKMRSYDSRKARPVAGREKQRAEVVPSRCNSAITKRSSGG